MKPWQTYDTFSWAPKLLRTVTAAMKLKDACSSDEKLDSVLKTRDVTLPTNVHLVTALVFPVVIYGCESRTIMMAERQRIDASDAKELALEKTLESPLDSKDIKPVNSKGNQPWIFIGRTDAEAEAPILWPPDVKSQLIGKDLMLGRLRAEGEGDAEDEWLHNITDSMDMNLSKFQVTVEERGVWCAEVHGS